VVTTAYCRRAVSGPDAARVGALRRRSAEGETAGLDDAQRKLILGGEAAMWEEIATAENLDAKLWPRMRPSRTAVVAGERDRCRIDVPASGVVNTCWMAGSAAVLGPAPECARLAARPIASAGSVLVDPGAGEGV